MDNVKDCIKCGEPMHKAGAEELKNFIPDSTQEDAYVCANLHVEFVTRVPPHSDTGSRFVLERGIMGRKRPSR